MYRFYSLVVGVLFLFVGGRCGSYKNPLSPEQTDYIARPAVDQPIRAAKPTSSSSALDKESLVYVQVTQNGRPFVISPGDDRTYYVRLAKATSGMSRPPAFTGVLDKDGKTRIQVLGPFGYYRAEMKAVGNDIQPIAGWRTLAINPGKTYNFILPIGGSVSTSTLVKIPVPSRELYTGENLVLYKFSRGGKPTTLRFVLGGGGGVYIHDLKLFVYRDSGFSQRVAINPVAHIIVGADMVRDRIIPFRLGTLGDAIYYYELVGTITVLNPRATLSVELKDLGPEFFYGPEQKG